MDCVAPTLPVCLIVAMARNRAIGINNTLPWKLPADLAHFKAQTLGKPIIMGRKTFDSLGRPLPGRCNIVISRQALALPERVLLASSLEQALTLAENVAQQENAAQQEGASEIMVIGGAQIYAEALPYATRLYVTEVAADVDGDAFFPELNAAEWQCSAREAHDADARNALPYAFCIYQRR